MSKLVSVVIPAYNHEKYIERAIKSVLEQTYKNIELIVINDGSTDSTGHVIRKIKKDFDFIYVNKCNEGLSRTLLRSLDMANGDYIAFLASDDVYFPNKIERQVEYLNDNPTCCGCCANVDIVDKSDNVFKSENTSTLQSYDFSRIMIEGYKIPPATLLIRKGELTENCFREYLEVEDLFLWLSLVKDGGTIDVLPDVLAYYRVHDTNTTANLALIAKGHHQTIDLFKEEVIYDKAKVSWSKFSFRQLTRRYKMESLAYISPKLSFFISREFLFGLIKLLLVWK